METEQVATAVATQTTEHIFTELVQAHIDELYNYASYMVFDRDDADDIVQKTFISLHQQLPKLDTQSSIKPWLFRVAKNHCLDYFKAKRATVFSDIEESVVLDLPESTPSVDSQFETEQFQEQVKACIGQLPLPCNPC
jgi:RNA polymerase sigma-70 factor (ECF subfamily)